VGHGGLGDPIAGGAAEGGGLSEPGGAGVIAPPVLHSLRANRSVKFIFNS
jgi:hypothetical protein